MGIAATTQTKESLATPVGSRNPATDGAAITCRNVSVRFFTDRRSVTALSGIDLEVSRGELLTLLGPSGCGKSTLLRAVADLVTPSTGEIRVHGSTAAAARRRRDIGFVFQDPALLPWRSALQNVELPLEVADGGKHKGKATPRELLELVVSRAGRARFRTNCPGVCANACRSRGRWSVIRRSCSWTSRSARSTKSPAIV